MFIEALKSKQGEKVYKSILIRETYRDSGKVRHRTLANITRLPASVIQLIKGAISGESGFSLDSIGVSHSREYGGSYALLELARAIGLDGVIYSRKEQWRQDALAMTAGRILWQGSKLSLVNLSGDTALWQLCGHDDGSRPDVDASCYQVLDRLLERQPAIQKQLAAKHLDDGCLILYDITNTWLEGEYKDSELAVRGIGKGGKKGYKQIAVGLIANRQGCPVAVEVFRGNTSDQTTVWDQARRLAEGFNVKEVIFAGDRGMLTPKRISEVASLGFRTLTALTHPQMYALWEKKVIQPELFDEKNIVEVSDPDLPGIRHMLCKNPQTLRRERETRASMIAAVRLRLDVIAKVARRRDQQEVCARVGKIFGRCGIAKFFDWNVDGTGKLTYSLKEEAIEREAALDGCYIIRTDAAPGSITKDEAVSGYKSLTYVEKAFRNLKTVALEMRPVYHKTDDRLRAHVFVCFLSYYLLWHVQQRLAPLFACDGEGAGRRWSVQAAIERLKSLREERLLVDGVPVRQVITTPDPEQLQILELLGIKTYVASRLK